MILCKDSGLLLLSSRLFLVCKRPRPSPQCPGTWEVAHLDTGTVLEQEPSSRTTLPGRLSVPTLVTRPTLRTQRSPLGVDPLVVLCGPRSPAGRHLRLSWVSLVLHTVVTRHLGSSHGRERVQAFGPHPDPACRGCGTWGTCQLSETAFPPPTYHFLQKCHPELVRTDAGTAPVPRKRRTEQRRDVHAERGTE